MSETYSKVRPTEIADPPANGGLFGDKPRISVFLPNVLRTAHDYKEVEVFKCWDSVALIQLDGVPLMTSSPPKVAKRARMLD